MNHTMNVWHEKRSSFFWRIKEININLKRPLKMSDNFHEPKKKQFHILGRFAGHILMSCDCCNYAVILPVRNENSLAWQKYTVGNSCSFWNRIVFYVEPFFYLLSYQSICIMFA